MAKPGFLFAVVLALLVAGCASPSETPDAVAPGATDASPGTNETLPPGAMDASESNRTLGAMPHVHDYWKGRERVTVLDTDVTSDGVNAVFWAFFTTFLLHEPSAGGAFVELANGSLVYEGAGQLDVTVTHTDPTVTGMRFTYRHAGDDDFVDWVPAPSGKMLSIPVTPDMTDMPHTKQSRWAFIFTAAGTPAVAIGKFHVKMEIVKVRDVTLFPAHPDFWRGATQLEILHTDGKATSSQAPVGSLERLTNPLTPPPNMMGHGKPVPMETKELLVNLTVKTVNPSTLNIDHVRLYYHAADGFEFEMHEATRPTKGADGKTWITRIPVLMNQTDNPYAEKGSWDFRVAVSYTAPVPGMPPCDDGCYNAETTFDFLVTAVKDDAMTSGM